MENIKNSSEEIIGCECPQCGGRCGEVPNTCMFGSYSKDVFYYCDKCRITYACDENGKKIRIN